MFTQDIVVPLVVRNLPLLPVISGGMPYPVVNDKASVPLVVMGEPLTVKPVGALSATELTDPLPAPVVGVYAIRDLFILMQG